MEATEVKKQMDGLGEALKTIQDNQKKYEEGFDTVDDIKKKTDGLDFEAMKNAAEAASKFAEELSKEKAKREGIEKSLNDMKTDLYRLGEPSKKQDQSIDIYTKAFKNYLYTGQEISPEVIGNYQKALVEFKYKNEPENRKKDALSAIEKSCRESRATIMVPQNAGPGGWVAEQKDLVGGTNPTGGYWIQPDRRSETVGRIFETSPIRSVARTISTVNREVEMIIDDNESASGGWVGEVENRPVTATADIGLLSIPAHEQFAQPRATRNMVDDAGFDLEAWIQRKTTDIITRTENTAFVVGDGSKKPKGFLDFPAWANQGVYERGAIEQRNSGSTGAFTFGGVIELQTDLTEPYQARAIFMTKRKNFADIILLKDLEGRSLWDFELLRRGGTEMNLAGKPVIFADDIPAVASDALAMVYGDFSVGYTVVDRIGFTLIRDELTEKPFILFYTIKRTGGTVTNYESLKIQKLAA